MRWRARLLSCIAATVLGFSTASAQMFATLEDVDEYISTFSVRGDQVLFIVRSLYPYSVDLEFYSDDRNVSWPGDGQVYTLKNDAWHVFLLNCQPGEKICYGAGPRNRYDLYWGVGINMRSGCDRCCWQCSGETTRAITLN